MAADQPEGLLVPNPPIGALGLLGSLLVAFGYLAQWEMARTVGWHTPRAAQAHALVVVGFLELGPGSATLSRWP